MSNNVYPTAFCTTSSILTTLTPEDAHALSLEGKIGSRYDFQCSEDCNFKLTLVNFKTVLTSNNKSPYYRTSKLDQVHNREFCDLMQRNYQLREQETEAEESYTFLREKSRVKIHIDLVYAVLATIPTSQTVSPIQGPFSDKARHKSADRDTILKEAASQVRSLKHLVSYFRDWKHGEQYTFIDNSGDVIDLSEHFIDLDKSPNLEEHVSHVYYGKASVLKRRGANDEEFYLLRLSTPCTLNHISIAPTFLINASPDKHTENGKVIRGAKSQLKVLERASKSGETLTLYFLGAFKSYQNKYINPDIEHSQLLKYLVFSKE